MKTDKRVPEGRARLLHSVLATRLTNPTRADLAEFTGLGTRTVDKHIAVLRNQGLMTPDGYALGGHALGYILSIVVRSETVQAGLVDPHGEVVHRAALSRVPNQRSMKPGQLIDTRVVPVVRQLFETLPWPGPVQLLAVTTAWPTPIKADRPVGHSMNEAWRTGRTLPEVVAVALGVPRERVHVVNDAIAHALGASYLSSCKAAEKAAAKQLEDPNHATTEQYHDHVDITLHLGGVVGAAVMVQKREVPGKRLGFIDSISLSSRRAGDIAHLPLTEQMLRNLNPDSSYEGLEDIDVDRKCFCLASRHLQCHVSDEAVRARLGNRDPEKFYELLAQKDMEDAPLEMALQHAGRLIGLVMISPLKLLDPETVNLTGMLARHETAEGIIDGLKLRQWSNVKVKVNVREPDENQWLGVRGAALMAFRVRVYRELEELVQQIPAEHTFPYSGPRTLGPLTSFGKTGRTPSGR